MFLEISDDTLQVVVPLERAKVYLMPAFLQAPSLPRDVAAFFCAVPVGAAVGVGGRRSRGTVGVGICVLVVGGGGGGFK